MTARQIPPSRLPPPKGRLHSWLAAVWIVLAMALAAGPAPGPAPSPDDILLQQALLAGAGPDDICGMAGMAPGDCAFCPGQAADLPPAAQSAPPQRLGAIQIAQGQGAQIHRSLRRLATPIRGPPRLGWH